ncbi:hypothetical protein EWM64_g4938 [Hericium alpestre]|uniref:Reverse transcriptase domain-containing protein n=1 Tax=Hericium alpestre TaxID=135208 RepID=A0A4Y9ZXZ8_9AGAM|nr:hypothetical protein EWM64_g4938 [Hericium alpestre]
MFAIIGEGTDSEDEIQCIDAPLPALYTDSLVWNCLVDGPSVDEPVSSTTLIDDGSQFVLIRASLASTLGLSLRLLSHPVSLGSAFSGGGNEVSSGSNDCIDSGPLPMHDSAVPASSISTHWVKLFCSSPDSFFHSHTVCALIVPDLLAYPIILGLPFLTSNCLVVDAEFCSCVSKDIHYDLLHPAPPLGPVTPSCAEVLHLCKELLIGLDAWLMSQHANTNRVTDSLCTQAHVVASMRNHIWTLAHTEQLQELDRRMKSKFTDCFPADILHVNKLLTNVYHHIKLKDPDKVIKTHSYACPCKYHEAWQTLIQQHLDAGHIHPSSSAHTCPSFLIPKADPTAMLWWVNDYHPLNANMIPDSYPLPCIDNILTDCAKGKIWAKLDMTNSFFQTQVHPDDVHLMAVMTPFGNYEWPVMPMGCCNAPATHQHRMINVLRKYIGKICHVYLDDIIILSQSVAEHIKNVTLILEALCAASLFCSLKKTSLFCEELSFLGHTISARGIEADSSKVDRILSWPVPKKTSDVCAFLGLVRYLAKFLPQLAEFTRILTSLTTIDAERTWPGWSPDHQAAFNRIKSIVVGRECLTTIDQKNPGNNKIFVTCDASDWCTGGILSFGPTWKLARLVTFDSMQLKGTKLNYPVHEKELLAIKCALEKWRIDLLGSPFIVCTDHHSLEYFMSQTQLSC